MDNRIGFEKWDKPFVADTNTALVSGKMKKTMPKCHWTSGIAYPLCFGEKSPQEFAENDCATCSWYSEYWREHKMKELAEIKEINIDEFEIETIKI